MHHMMSCFNLRDGEVLEDFRADFEYFTAEMIDLGLLEHAGPIGERVADTPMDTDENRDLRYFNVMSFIGRAQLDAAYAYILEHVDGEADTAHTAAIARVADPIFFCWRDL